MRTILLALLAATAVIHTNLAVAEKQPNIVLVVGDDVGFTDLGSYGSEISTPTLDALAATGVKFTNFHVTASCSPTRSMLMTGVDNHLNGVGNMQETTHPEHVGKPGYEGVLNHKVVTIAEMLKAQGYHTYHVGKWHLGYAPEKRPYNRGFTQTVALLDTGADNWEQRTYAPFYDKAHWVANGEEHTLPDDFYSSKYFVDKTIEFIDAGRKTDGENPKPFLAYIPFQAVHIPIQAPEEFSQKYIERYTEGWHVLRQQRLQKAIELGIVPASTKMVEMASTRTWGDLPADEQATMVRRMAVYAGMLDAMDFHLGRLVTHLKEIGEYDNTIFVFLSDNGAEPTDPLQMGVASSWFHIWYDNDPERLGLKNTNTSIGPSWASAAAAPGAYYKFFAGEGGVRVPLIISWPKKLPQGSMVNSLAHIKDVLPTLLELSNTPDHQGTFNGERKEKITGRSLVPVLQGKADTTHGNTPIGYELSGNAALYRGAYKLVRNLPPVGDGKWYLYNIETDPGETTNLSETQPQRFKTMLADYQAYAAANNVLEMPEGYNYRKQLKWFGVKAYFARTWWMWLIGLFASLTIAYKLIAALLRRRRKRG